MAEVAERAQAAVPPQGAPDVPESPALETWRRFTRHRVGVVALGVVLVLFALSFLGRFLVASDPFVQHRDAAYWPPQRVRIIDAEGRLTRPFVYGFERALHPETFQWEYAVDESNVTELALFARGPVYRVLWLFDWDVHLVGTVDGAPVFFLGTDRFGRDLLARLLWGGMVSLSVPVLAVAITVLLGTLIGAMSGYFGGWVDNLIQRVIEVLASFPRLPLWMALAAVIPPEFQGVALYAGMAVILAIIGWGRLARQVRGKVLQLRQMEYVVGARALGASPWRVIGKYIVPNASSHIIVMATLYVPEYLLVESSLSFLGIGLTPPLTSWGVLLSDAQKVRVVLQYPWLLIPGLFICVAMLAFNFVGDAVRDAFETRHL